MSAPPPPLGRQQRALGLMAERLRALRLAQAGRFASGQSQGPAAQAFREALKAVEAQLAEARASAQPALGALEAALGALEAQAQRLQPPGVAPTGRLPSQPTARLAEASEATQARGLAAPGLEALPPMPQGSPYARLQGGPGNRTWHEGEPLGGPRASSGREASPQGGATPLGASRPSPPALGAPKPGQGLRAWFAKLSAPAQAEAARPPEVPQEVEHPRRVALRQAWRLAGEVLAFVSPRLQLVAVALGSAGLPGPGRPWPEVQAAMPQEGAKRGLPPEGLGWVGPLATLFLAHGEATRRGHGAVVQWEACQGLHAKASALLPMLPKHPAPLCPGALQAFDLPAYRASVHPISHLHLTFQGLPHLAQLFPPPEA